MKRIMFIGLMVWGMSAWAQQPFAPYGMHVDRPQWVYDLAHKGEHTMTATLNPPNVVKQFLRNYTDSDGAAGSVSCWMYLNEELTMVAVYVVLPYENEGAVQWAYGVLLYAKDGQG